jgi:hypothetical protein
MLGRTKLNALQTAAIIFCCFSATTAHAEEASGGFNIALQVPVVCDLDATDFALDQSQAELSGTVNEFCNSSRGFQVVASHRPLELSETVEVNYGGEQTRLERGGLSNIAFRSGPRLSTVPVRIRVTGLETQLSVSFAITAV